MKIIHVIDGLGRGGAETLLMNTIQLLPDDEHIIICLSAAYDFEVSLKKHFVHYVFPVQNKLNIPRIILSIRKLIKKHKPDIVHAHLLFPGILTKLACPKKIPLFYSIHSAYSFAYFSRNRFIKFLENFTARPYHHLIGVSQVVIDDYVRYVPGSGSRDVLYNFVNEQFFKINNRSTYKPGMPLRCLAVGNLKYEKNYAYILSQFTLLKEYPVTLDIYGTGSDETGLKKYKADHILDHVEFKGKSDKITEIMPGYDLFITCSVSEGFGIAPLEAMAARLPVIVSNIPVFNEIIKGVGFFVQTESEKPGESLSAVLIKIFSGQLNLSEHIETAFERTKKIAAPENYIAQLKQIYQKYLA